MIKGVIFDWNGTLSDDVRKVFAVAMKTVKKVGGKPLSFAEFRKKVRNPYHPFYRDDMGCNVSRAELNKWYGYYFKREKTRAKLFSDAIPLLRFLKAQNVKVGIVSSHPAGFLAAETKSYGLMPFLGFVRGGCHTKASHIGDFLKSCKLKPGEVIFVGDMIFDIEEGKRCKVITAAYLRGMDPKEKLLPSKPDIVLPNLSALKKYL